MQLGLFTPTSPVSDFASITGALDDVTLAASMAIPDAKKALLSQYFTPIAIAKQMASMVNRDDVNDIGDNGAGTGILSSTLIAMKHKAPGSKYRVKAYELDTELHPTIQRNIDMLSDYVDATTPGAVSGEINSDFMDMAGDILSGIETPGLDAVVLNPPYKKLNQQTELAKLFKSHGVSVPNLYAAFMVLSVLMLRDNGEMVAIVPRSFCNGDYYRSFRDWLYQQGSIDWFVRYKRRSNAFRDNILQENVILRFTKGIDQVSAIRVSLCDDPNAAPEFEGLLPAFDVLDPHSGAIHIPSNDLELAAIHEVASRSTSFSDAGLNVSTGKVEVNRVSKYLSDAPGIQDHVPVVYAQHWSNSERSLSWSDDIGKKCYLSVNDFTLKKCVPAGRYILVKRISANDDRSGRCHPCFVKPGDLPGDLWAFDNHVQVISVPGAMDDHTVIGLVDSMASDESNHFFRVVSGTTQLNCNDIKKLRFNI